MSKINAPSGPDRHAHGMDLSSASHVPKYAQIADIFRQRIARGTWARGSKLPANEALADEFGVSRVTIRQAVELLARDGLLEAQQGRGTFITGSLTQDRWLRVETTLADLAEVYRDTSPEIINIAESLTEAPLTAADGKAAARYVFMRRVHSRDGQPYCVISIYLDEKIFRRSPAKFRKQTVIPILNDLKDPAIDSARQTLTIGTADLEVARLLRVPLNSPVAEVRRVFTSADNTVIYLGEVTYRGDFVRIEMDLRT
jgi:GntR family transcriptional regulator